MGSKTLPSGLATAQANSPLYGAVIANLAEETPTAVLAAVAGDTSQGRPFGFYTAAPTLNIGRETVNISENIMGLSTRLKGSEQLQNEEVTVELEAVVTSIDLLQYALPGTVKADWTPTTSASLTAGTGNSSVRVRALQTNTAVAGTAGNSILLVISTPTGSGPPQATVTVSGTAPAYTITVAPKTTATANDVVAAINAHATAKTIVQAGLPAGTTGTGVIAALVSTPLAGGATGTRIGYQITSNGYWQLADYIRAIYIYWENTATQVGMLARCKNAISMDDFSFQADDGGQVAGVGMTFTATSDETDYNATTGNYLGPFSIMKLDDIAIS